MIMIMIIIIMMIDEADHDDDSDDQERWNIEPERSEIWLGRDLQHRRAVPGGRESLSLTSSLLLLSLSSSLPPSSL